MIKQLVEMPRLSQSVVRVLHLIISKHDLKCYI